MLIQQCSVEHWKAKFHSDFVLEKHNLPVISLWFGCYITKLYRILFAFFFFLCVPLPLQSTRNHILVIPLISPSQMFSARFIYLGVGVVNFVPQFASDIAKLKWAVNLSRFSIMQQCLFLELIVYHLGRWRVSLWLKTFCQTPCNSLFFIFLNVMLFLSIRHLYWLCLISSFYLIHTNLIPIQILIAL